MTPPSSLSLIISGLIKAAKAVQINTCKKKSKETAEKSLGDSVGKMRFLWSQYCFQPNVEEDAAVSWIRCETAGLMILGYLLRNGQSINQIVHIKHQLW